MVKPLQDKVSTPGKQHSEGPPGAALPVSTHKINREGHAAHFPVCSSVRWSVVQIVFFIVITPFYHKLLPSLRFQYTII